MDSERIVFSNGTDELKILLPSGLTDPDEWFEAPVRLRVGSLCYEYSGAFQVRDFCDIFYRLNDVLVDGSGFEFDCTEGHLSFSVKKHDSLGHYRIDMHIEQPPTVITTSFVLDYSDMERVVHP